ELLLIRAKCGDDAAHRHLGANTRDDCLNIAVRKSLDIFRRFVGFDRHQRRADRDKVADAYQPSENSDVTARRTDIGDNDLCLHFEFLTSFAPPSLPIVFIQSSTSRCIARRPATSTSLARPEPITSYGFKLSEHSRHISRIAPKNACFNALPTLTLRIPIS